MAAYSTSLFFLYSPPPSPLSLSPRLENIILSTSVESSKSRGSKSPSYGVHVTFLGLPTPAFKSSLSAFWRGRERNSATAGRTHGKKTHLPNIWEAQGASFKTHEKHKKSGTGSPKYMFQVIFWNTSAEAVLAMEHMGQWPQATH